MDKKNLLNSIDDDPKLKDLSDHYEVRQALRRVKYLIYCAQEQYKIPTSPVCLWCIKHSYDMANGQLELDECIEGMQSEEFGLFDEQHDCLARTYDLESDTAWTASCNCWCNQ